MNEGALTVAADSSASDKNGTLEGDPQWVAGKFGQGLQLDGDDYVQVVGFDKLNNQGAAAVSFWANPTAANAGYAFWAPNISLIAIESGKNFRVRWHLQNAWRGTHVTSPNSVVVSDWAHWVFDFNGGTTTIYKDGVSLEAGTDAEVVFSNLGTDLFLGWRSATNGIQGTIDDYRVYNVSLTAADVAAIYNGGGGDLVGVGRRRKKNGRKSMFCDQKIKIKSEKKMGEK